MKQKMRSQIRPRGDSRPLDEQIAKEIAGFYRALDSYVRQAAAQPGLTFEEHLSNILNPDNLSLSRSRTQ
jgi:hypothetical protein